MTDDADKGRGGALRLSRLRRGLAALTLSPARIDADVALALVSDGALLIDVRQPSVQLDRVAPGVPTEQGEPAVVSAEHPEQDPDRGRLAGAVGPEEAVHLPRIHPEVEVVERADPGPEVLHQPGEHDRGGHGHPPPDLTRCGIPVPCATGFLHHTAIAPLVAGSNVTRRAGRAGATYGARCPGRPSPVAGRRAAITAAWVRLSTPSFASSVDT